MGHPFERSFLTRTGWATRHREGPNCHPRCASRGADVAGEILKSIGLPRRIFTTEAQRHGGIGDENPHSRPLRVVEWGTLEVILVR
jgi:hypothetical protein